MSVDLQWATQLRSVLLDIQRCDRKPLSEGEIETRAQELFERVAGEINIVRAASAIHRSPFNALSEYRRQLSKKSQAPQ